MLLTAGVRLQKIKPAFPPVPSQSEILSKSSRVETAVILPHTLNLQAIDLCNSRCLMCHIWKDGRREKMSLDELRQELARPFYSEVRHVGITGGEPTLRQDLAELYELLPQVLPTLTGASFITHGMQTERTVKAYARVHEFYRRRNLAFNGMVSLDGVGAVHDLVRGRKGAFDSASRTLLQFKARGVGVMAACTIIRSNVYGLHDLLDWGKAHGVYVRFRVAEFIRRLYNDSCADEIRGFNPRELRHLVSFFHVLLGEYETEETIRKTYTSILSLLTGGERLIGCPFQKGVAVNVDSRGWLACCAPKADAFAPAVDVGEIHSTLTAQRAEVAQAHCANCIHDYHDDWNAAASREIVQAKNRSRELYEVAEELLTTPELPAQPLDLTGMKQLLLAGWYGTETAGDIAILHGIINEYLAVNPQLQFQVLSLFPYYTRTTVALWPEALRSRVNVIDYASEAAWQATLDCDAVVMAGGPLMDIPDTRKILCLFKRFADLNKPRVIEGCGIGPLNRAEFRWNVCRIARLATQISVRDGASRDNLRLYGIRKPIEVRLDPAVTFIRSQGIRHHVSEAKVIRCFLRELTCEYPQATSSAQATQNLELLLRRLLAWYPEHRIELWAMHHFPVGWDDRLFARQLVKQIADPRLTAIWEPRTPKEILEAMAAAAFCVCMRFHSCVFATEVGVPFLAIDYTAGGKIKAFFDDHHQPDRVCTLTDLPGLQQEQLETKLRLPIPTATADELVSTEVKTHRPPRILHLIQYLIGGGGARAMISLAQHSRRLAGYEHRLVSLMPADDVGLELARQANLPVLNHPSRDELQAAIADADIVLVHWWNNADLAALFRRDLPAMRLALWLHVGGYHSPQVLQPPLIDFADLTVACSPHTYAHPVFTSLPQDIREQRTAMVLAGAEFDRLKGFTPQAHSGFQVGYIGTVDPVKMHAEFVDLSCAVNVPDVKFVVCGNGDTRWLTDRAEKLGRSASFDFRGHVEDIRSVLETLDVYGYPLCPDTYAAAELNLQEVMFAGVPVVAFPHGGIGTLIRHGETGILVNTPEEYARAIEQLCQNPAERARLGANAAAFARQHWGAENAAREFNDQFERLLNQPKRTRQWEVPSGAEVSNLPPSLADQVPQLAIHPGARLFVESLAEGAQSFLDSLTATKLDAIVGAEERIAGLSRLVHHNGILPYRDAHPKDPLLQLWAGLGFLRADNAHAALESFMAAWQNGFVHWRIHWYRALMAEHAGRPAEVAEALKLLLQAAPDFAPAQEMQRRLGMFVPEPKPQPFPSPAETARNCVQQAERFLQQNQPAPARDWLVRALDLVPRHPEVMELLAELDCQLGNHDAARQLYENLVAQNPLRQSPRLEKIRTLLGLKSKPMQATHAISSPEAASLVQTAVAALRRDDVSAAITALQSAGQLDPRHAGVLITLASLQSQANDFSAAIVTLQAAASQAPDDPLVQVLLARAFVRVNRIQEFESALARALEIDAGFAPAHRLLGDLLLENQQHAEAVKHYRQALTHSVPDAGLLRSLATCLEQCGEAEAAATVREEILRLAPAGSAYREAIDLLEVIVFQPAMPDPVVSPKEVCGDSSATAVCPVCSANAPVNLVKMGHAYHRCPECECVFTPRIDKAVLKTENSGGSARHDQNQDAIRWQRLVTALGRHAKEVIDFGCGKGETTEFIRSQGVNAMGIDQDTALQLKDVADDSVDGIMMVEVIEHLYAPHEIFQQFNRVLKTGGVVYLESSFADEKDLAAWNYLDPAIGHCTVHSLRSMGRLAEKNGFDIAWLNANVCCFTKKVTLTQAAENPMVTDNVEIIGDGIPDPIVSVVISTYASEKFMRPCLENLSRQTIFNRCEILVVDSGSPQNERAIVLEFQQKFPNIRYVRTERETLYAAWNRSLGLARGRFWANANTDDSLRDDALEILVAAMDKHTECALAYADYAWTDKPNDTFPSSNILRTVKNPDYVPAVTLFYCITGCLQFWRKDALRQLGGFDATMRGAADYGATLRLMEARKSAVIVPEVLAWFYQNRAGISQASDTSTKEMDVLMNRARNTLDISNIFCVEPDQPAAAAHAWTALGIFASKFIVPWEDQLFEHLDFALACYQKALAIDPDNKIAGLNLLRWYSRLNRLNEQTEAALVNRWPKMRKWIRLFRAGEVPELPPVKNATMGPVYRPFEIASRPTKEQLAQEPAALRPWICRIDGRHVYLSEELFPRPAGLRYQPSELEAGAKRLAALLAELPPFYAHFGGAGDALLLLASFYDQSPDAVVFSHPNGVGAMKSLFAAFPKLSKIYFLPIHAEPFFHIMLRYAVQELRNCRGAGTTPKDNYGDEWISGLDLEKKYQVSKTPRWAAALRDNENSRWVAVAPKGSMAGMVGSKRNIILPELWPAVIAHIVERGFEPVILGMPSEAKEYPALPGCTDARGESFPGQMKLIGQCAGLVGADSWAKTFSALAEIPTIVFEPVKGADLAGWKDPAEHVFIEPWPAIKLIRSFAEFRRDFDRHIARLSEAEPQGNPRPVISWEGSFLDHGSLSHVNRELVGALRDFPGAQIKCVSNGAAIAAGAMNIWPELVREVSWSAGSAAAVTVRHAWPPNWKRPATGKLAVIQPWEFGSLPQEWVRQARDVDEFWVPSNYVRNLYVESGVPAKKVFVVPNGVDAEKFNPHVAPLKLATQKQFKFLFVGGTIGRKGPDLLLQAYLKNFSAADDVCLVIKDFGGKNVYAGQTFEAQIRKVQAIQNAPEILYLNEEMPPESLPGLYAACHCFILPYRGEGFGLPVLEAMACGLPVMVTAGGATDDFVRDEFAWRIPAVKKVFGREISGLKLVHDGWLLEPDLAALGQQMRQVFGNPAEARERGRRASRHARQHFSWKNSAAIVQQRLGKLLGNQPSPAQLPRVPVQFPSVAHLGRLDEARELFARKEFPAAWESARIALAKRPFHPEAQLLLAEIALAAGNGKTAKLLAQHARDLAPGWQAPKQFLAKPLKSDAKLDWFVLPESIGNRQSAVGNRLSVCLIVKNEEKFLAQCLKSVRGLSAQIIVVDTGSTDRTVDIAREFGAEIYSFAWCDDFAAARNAALEHATGDWVLMLDADEELPSAQHAALLADLKKSSTLAHRLPLVNAGQNDGRSFVPRLFRNAPGVYYSGRIHEQVFPSLLPHCKNWGLKTALGTAEILHHGYTRELVCDRNKIERNLKLLRLAVEENPADVNLAMNLGLELVRSDDLAGGVEKYREAFQMMSAQPAGELVPELREVLLTQFTSQLYKLRAHAEVVEVLQSPLARQGGLTASLHLALGLAQFELKQFSEAADQMRQCLIKRQQPALSPINTDIHTAAPQHCLALSLAKLGDLTGAEKTFQLALAEPGGGEHPRLDFAKFLAAQNRFVDALQQLHEIVTRNPRHAAAWRLGGEITLGRPELLEFAREWTGEALRALPENSVLAEQCAEALLLNGDTAAALEFLEKIWDRDRSVRTLAALILCETVEFPTTHAPDEGAAELAASRAFIEWYQKLIALRASALTLRINEQLDKLSRALPTAARMLESALQEAETPAEV